jgi:Spy/CpxP family protein refolding chaperone
MAPQVATAIIRKVRPACRSGPRATKLYNRENVAQQPGARLVSVTSTQLTEKHMEYKSRKGLGFILAGVIALCAGGALVFAHGGKGGHERPGGEDMANHFQAHVKKVLAEVDATPEQQARINAIVETASGDLKTLHGQHSGSMAQLHELLTAPTIDRGRLEQMRAQHIAALDAASQRCTTAMADAAEVLTPAQRAQLGEKMAKRHGGIAKGH